VASAGNLTLDLIDDGGFIFGVGAGANRISGPQTGVPTSGVTPFSNLTVMSAYNTTVSAPTGQVVVVNFPAAGTYRTLRY
jgi:hypothetical protein